MILNENLFEDVELTLDDKIKFINEYPTYTTDRKTYFTRGCRYNELGLTPEQEDTFFKFLQDGELNNFWIENAELSDKIYQAGRMGGHLILDDEDAMPADWEDFNTFDDVLEAERDEYRYYDTPLDDWEEKQARENAEEKVNLTYQKLVDFDNRVDELITNLKLELDGYVDLDELNSDDNFQESYKKVVKAIEPLYPEVDRELSSIMASPDKSFPYMMLDRLRADCAYVLGAGNGNTKHLWFDGDVDKQIALMKGIYRELDEKPEWISLEDIDNYEKQLKSITENNGDSIRLKENINDFKWYYVTINRSEKQGSDNVKEHIYSILVDAKSEEEARRTVDTGMQVLAGSSTYEIVDIHEATKEEVNSDTPKVQNQLHEDLEITTADTDIEMTKDEIANGMMTTLNSLIQEELNAVQLYNDAIIQCQALGYDNFKEVFESLVSEETLHVGELQKLLDTIKPSTISDIEDGQEEAADLLDDKQPEEIAVEEDPEEGQHY